MSVQRSEYCEANREGFPPLAEASKDGLLAMGGDLSPTRLQCAYSLGIFPWFEEGQPILWWSPDPRCVLYPHKFKTSRSLRKSIAKSRFTVTFDSCFEQIMQACASPRDGQKGTWITAEMKYAYGKLHELGCAHSVEVWQDGQLVGGLYGVALGKVFYGESMFSQVRDASKMALKVLSETLVNRGYRIIDCQVESAHLLSLGAQTISREQFIQEMNQALAQSEADGAWLDQVQYTP